MLKNNAIKINTYLYIPLVIRPIYD